jgi:hypothetical protein
MAVHPHSSLQLTAAPTNLSLKTSGRIQNQNHQQRCSQISHRKYEIINVCYLKQLSLGSNLLCSNRKEIQIVYVFRMDSGGRLV